MSSVKCRLGEFAIRSYLASASFSLSSQHSQRNHAVLSGTQGHFFTKPVLSPYELNVALGEEHYREVYPMDFYKEKSGRWSNYHEDNRHRVIQNEA